MQLFVREVETAHPAPPLSTAGLCLLWKGILARNSWLALIGCFAKCIYIEESNVLFCPVSSKLTDQN